jgi:hypothetical protein
MPKEPRQVQLLHFEWHFKHTKIGNIFHYFLPPGAISGCLWTLDLKIMRRLFYHRTTAAGSNPVNFADVTKS